jgi:hypothetical protein
MVTEAMKMNKQTVDVVRPEDCPKLNAGDNVRVRNMVFAAPINGAEGIVIQEVWDIPGVYELEITKPPKPGSKLFAVGAKIRVSSHNLEVLK